MEPRILKVKTEKEADEICRLMDANDEAAKEGKGRWMIRRKLWKAFYKACPEAAEEGTERSIGMNGPLPVLREKLTDKVFPEPKKEPEPAPAPKKLTPRKKAKK